MKCIAPVMMSLDSDLVDRLCPNFSSLFLQNRKQILQSGLFAHNDALYDPCLLEGKLRLFFINDIHGIFYIQAQKSDPDSESIGSGGGGGLE